MFRTSVLALVGGIALLTSGLSGQDAKKGSDAKKDEATAKLKGFLPQNWAKIGLTDDQKQQVYKVQSKYAAEIEKAEAKVKELKGSRDQDMKAVLSADQKKKLEEILTGKAK